MVSDDDYKCADCGAPAELFCRACAEPICGDCLIDVSSIGEVVACPLCVERDPELLAEDG